jgi:hypothetical protein
MFRIEDMVILLGEQKSDLTVCAHQSAIRPRDEDAVVVSKIMMKNLVKKC